MEEMPNKLNLPQIANGITAQQDSENDELTLDAILIRIGQFGKFQLLLFLLISVPMLFNAIFSVTYIFTASNVVHRCNISECDSSSSLYNEPWTEYAIPKKGKDIDQCQRYDVLRISNESLTEPFVCVAESFDKDRIISCPDKDFIFRDNENTISNEFGIYCDDEWKLSMVGTVNNVGQFIGIPLGGLISDKYGRSKSVAIGGVLAAIFGIIRSFSTTYLFFLIFEFLDNVACATLYGTCFIIGIELVGPNVRVLVCSIITICYSVGEIILGLAAKYSHDWRLMLRILYIPALVQFAYFWILPESVRWLLSQGREEPAKSILQRAARFNKRRLSDNALEKLMLTNRSKLEATTESKFPIRAAFTTLFWRILNCSFCWIVNVLVYYGLSLNAVLLAGDKYNNFIFIALVEIPGFILPLFTMEKFGRRYSLFSFMFLSGLCCLGTVFFQADQYAVQLLLFLIGKLAITASFHVLYFFTAEIFPTNARNSLLSFCSMIGRFGSMVAPQTPLLSKYYENAPAILFAATAIISGCLSLLFPETTNLVLPTTIKDANDIRLKKKQLEADA